MIYLYISYAVYSIYVCKTRVVVLMHPRMQLAYRPVLKMTQSAGLAADV